MKSIDLLLGGLFIAAFAGGCAGGSDPAELARERGAVELLRSWPCHDGSRSLGVAAGGDLKTDWTASKLEGGAYRVTQRLAAGVPRTWTVHLAERAVVPDTDGARAAWLSCTAPPGK